MCRYNAGKDVVSSTTNTGFTTTPFTGDAGVAIGATQDFSGATTTQYRWEINIRVRPRKLCRIEMGTSYLGTLTSDLSRVWD